MEKAKKIEVVEQLKQVFGDANIVIVSHNNGLTVNDANELRNKVRENGSKYQVAKNSLAKIALKGTQYEQLAELFSGPTSIAYSDEPVGAAKALVNFAKKSDEKLVILGAMMNDTYLDQDAVKQLASLPSLDELRGKIIGLLTAPAGDVARVVQAPASQLARVIEAYSKKEQ